MSAVRALNLAQHWLTDGADQETHHRVRALMTGPLATTIPPQSITSPDGRKRPPVPWWWGNDEDASASSMAAARTMRR